LTSSPPAAPLTSSGGLRSLLKKKWSDAAGGTKINRTGLSLTSLLSKVKKSYEDVQALKGAVTGLGPSCNVMALHTSGRSDDQEDVSIGTDF
jgi:hypothetical protein